jgi:hypothetical protein
MWRNDMSEEITRFNQVILPATPRRKTAAIQQWVQSVIAKMEYYKLKEATATVELALWKAKICCEMENDDTFSRVSHEKSQGY